MAASSSVVVNHSIPPAAAAAASSSSSSPCWRSLLTCPPAASCSQIPLPLLSFRQCRLQLPRRFLLAANNRKLASPLHSDIAPAAGLADGELVADESSLKGEEEEQISQRLQDLAESMVLPANYLGQLPNDLRVDLKDAAFALASGPLKRECGEQAGEVLTQLSRAWEKADTQATASAAKQLRSALPKEISSRAALGKRLIAAGRRFASTGYYAQGELQKIAKALIAAGEALSVSNLSEAQEEPFLQATRVYKFGDLEVQLTSQRCYIGCIVALIFGSLSWELTSSLQTNSESPLQYANANAVFLATSLKGTFLVLGYSCTVLSAIAMVSLFVLATQLTTKEK